MPRGRSQRLEELLELVAGMAERGVVREDAVQGAADALGATDAAHLSGAPVAGAVAEAAAAGLLTRRDGELRLTPAGEAEARLVVRRHRLAERLLNDLFALEPATAHEQACEFEHILLPEVTDAVCTLLGHPPVGVNGEAIPPGPCCAGRDRLVHPVIMSLREAPVGARARVAFMAPRSHKRLDRLAAVGLVPGSLLRLHQKQPSYVIELGETTLALDEEIAGEIFVRQVGE
ncbi:MAG TPA: metal-dependent transcriptional regulator [Polyangia bacterium]|jgi:DtxR family Mn-dependent transcriptional regulator